MTLEYRLFSHRKVPRPKENAKKKINDRLNSELYRSNSFHDVHKNMMSLYIEANDGKIKFFSQYPIRNFHQQNMTV